MCERGKHFPNESKRCKSNYKIKRDLRKTMAVQPFSLKNGYLNNCLKNAFFFFRSFRYVFTKIFKEHKVFRKSKCHPS